MHEFVHGYSHTQRGRSCNRRGIPDPSAPGACRGWRLEKGHQSGVGGGESTVVFVEVCEMLSVVSVEPAAAGTECPVVGQRHQAGPDASPSRLGGDHRVLEPGMRTAVPDHVDKADKVAAVSGDYPTQTVPVQEVGPAPSTVVQDAGAEGLGMELVELGIAARAAPFEVDGHGAWYRSGSAVDAEGRGDRMPGGIDHVPEAAVLIDGLPGDEARLDVEGVGVERMTSIGELGGAVGPLQRAHERSIDTGADPDRARLEEGRPLEDATIVGAGAVSGGVRGEVIERVAAARGQDPPGRRMD